MKVNDIIILKVRKNSFIPGKYSPDCYIIKHCKSELEKEVYILKEAITGRVMAGKLTMEQIEGIFVLDPYRNNILFKSIYV